MDTPKNKLGLQAIMILCLIAILMIGYYFTKGSSNQDSANQQAQAINAISQGQSVPGQYIIVFKKDTQDPQGLAKQLVTNNRGSLRQTYSNALKGFAANLSSSAAAALRNNPNIESVEEDMFMSLNGSQTGPGVGLDRIDQRSPILDGQYKYNATGAGVNLYVIDTGIRPTQTDFSGRVILAYSSINDGYGPEGKLTGDGCSWHGTHVASVAAGEMHGPARDATIYSVRGFDCTTGGGYLSSVLGALDWVTANATSPAVALMSVSGAYSNTLNTAVQNSIDRGITFVVSAGNANNSADACTFSPASVTGAITVGGVNSNQDQLMASSPTGSCVDLYAPGDNILGAIESGDTGESLQSGTSQAAALVAGAAAVYLEGHKTASPSEVSQAIIAEATQGTIPNLGINSNNKVLYTLDLTAGTTTPPPPPVDTGLKIGEWIALTAKTNVRPDPIVTKGKAASQLQGTKGQIIAGPASGNGYTWWKIDYVSGTDGWSIADYMTKTTAPVPLGINSSVTTTSRVNVRSTPSTSGAKLGTQSSGASGTIVSGPTLAEGYTWWYVDFSSGVDGWVVQDYLKQ